MFSNQCVFHWGILLESPNGVDKLFHSKTKKYDVKEAIKLLKENSITKFNETLDVAINIAIDTKY